MKQQPPHLPVDAQLRLRQQGQFNENPDSLPLEERVDDLIEVRRGSAKTERRPSIMPASLDSELILGACKDLTAGLSGGPCSCSRVSFLTAAEWLLSGRNSDDLFSFPAACGRLALDAKHIARETLRRLDSRRVDLIKKHFERFSLEWLAEPPASTEHEQQPLLDERPAAPSIPSDVVPPEALEPAALPEAA